MESREFRDMVVAALALSLAFSFLLSRRQFLSGNLSINAVLLNVGIAVVSVATGFILHELAHRFVSRKFGCHAEFRLWNFGLLLAIFTSFLGFLFAAPGAVYIYGENISRKQNVLISIAGPLTNIAGGILLLIISIVFFSSNQVFALIFGAAASLNFGLAFFNMIPFPPLDGSKVITWNPLIWGLVFFPLFALNFLI